MMGCHHGHQQRWLCLMMLLFFLFLQVILADGKQEAGFLRKEQEQDSTTATTSPTISSVSLITSTSPTAASSQLLLSKQTSSASSKSSQLSKLDALRNFDQPYSPTTLSPVSTTTTPVTVTSSPTTTTTTTTTPMITSSPIFTPISSSAASAAAVSALTMSRLDALRQDFVPGSSSISEAIEPETETVSSSSSSSSETVSTASLTAAASTAAATAASASTTSTTTTTTTINSNKKNITVGAYYYPWHNDDFHNDQGYLRAKLYPQQGPELGEYDDTEKYTIQQHIKFSDIGNINLWVTSWWGPERIEDITTQDTIMNLVEKENHPLKIALLYETTNRLTIDGEWALNADRVQSDIEYIQKEYFDQYTNSYYMIDGKPVIFIYLARKLERFGDYTKNESLLQRTVALMRETATQDIYVVGDHGFDPYPDDRMSDKAGLFNSSLLALDAISNYDIYGSVVGSSGNMYPGKERLDSYYFEHQRTWKAVAADFGCAYIPSVKPGYNDKGVRLDAMKTPLSRRLTPDSPEGSFFDASLERAMQLIDANADNLLMVTSFNEWHEDTQIEPVELEVETTEPYDLTTGLAYVGYGTLYLDILKNATTQYNSFSEYSIEYNVNNNV